MTNDEDVIFLGQKLHFLGLGKRPKTTVYSEVIPNLNKNK